MYYKIIAFQAVIILMINWINLGWTAGLHQGETSNIDAKVDSLSKLLPEKLVTIVDKTLDDQFAQIEKFAAHFPNMDKKKIFLITLPMENFIEDIYFPANRPAVIYPRVIFMTIYRELKKGKSKMEIARTLVNLQKQNTFEKIHKMNTQKKK
ncbi:MAG: hypothetical protein ACE5IW_13145 [bacterium]